MDEELQDQYISFLKTLSLRLDVQTVQFFLDERANAFPLYECALIFLTHNETMIRTAALTVVLNIYRVDDPGLRAFIGKTDNQVIFFKQIGQLMQDQTSQLLGYVLTAAESGYEERGQMDSTIQNFQDQLFYLQDVYDLGITSLSSALTDYLVDHFILPSLVDTLTAWHEPNRSPAAVEGHRATNGATEDVAVEDGGSAGGAALDALPHAMEGQALGSGLDSRDRGMTADSVRLANSELDSLVTASGHARQGMGFEGGHLARALGAGGGGGEVDGGAASVAPPPYETAAPAAVALFGVAQLLLAVKHPPLVKATLAALLSPSKEATTGDGGGIVDGGGAGGDDDGGSAADLAAEAAAAAVTVEVRDSIRASFKAGGEVSRF